MKSTCLALLCLAGCADSASPVDDSELDCDVEFGEIGLRIDGDQLAWDGEIWAIAVTSPGAVMGKFGRIDTGRLYWSIAAKEFDGKLTSPIIYGEVPESAYNWTTFAGGQHQGLTPGHCYEVQASDAAHTGFTRLQFRLDPTD